MRTGRSLTVCWSLLPGGGGVCSGGWTCPGGVPTWGVYLPGGCTCPGGVPAQGGVPTRGINQPRGCTCPGGCTCLGGVPAWGVYLPRGVYMHRGVPTQGCTCQGVYLPGGYTCPGGVPVQGSVPAQGEMYLPGHPPPPWTESHTPVKTLPWSNFVAAGNKIVQIITSNESLIWLSNHLCEHLFTYAILWMLDTTKLIH